ncbi:MAG: NAD(P)/FAD-dependent oxidoreductase [Actinomycetota bacterium]|nr:NAD(P)/FAD-dependent oxidoreductase [Actinomycetota bacterium]
MIERAEVVVIGMGPGGEEVAGRLAEAGLDVVGIDRELVGGECPYWGCVPSKMAIRAANLLAEARRIRGVAGNASVTADWEPVATRIRDEATDDWDDRVAVERFEGKGGRFVRGEARLAGRGRVAVGDREITVDRAVVVATGTRPVIPPIEGLADIPYWTNREAMEAKELPSSLVVLGGGAIGVELGQVFARFGSRVTVVEAADQLLPLDEPEAGAVVTDELRADGISVRTGSLAQRVERDGHRFAVVLRSGDVVTGEQVLVATGRRPDPAAVGLDTIGVPADAKAAPVDEHLRVGPGVWAVGDVTGKGAFTHVAMYQARIAVADILGEAHEPADYRALPRVTFTDPEVGSVGLTEAAARDAGITVRVGYAALPSSARGWIHKRGNNGLVKLVADGDRGVLVGATSVGPAGGEILGLLTLAVHAEVPLARLREMMYAYPTFHRAVEDALRDLG